MCSSLGLSYLGLCASWTWLTISFPMLGKFSTIISSSIFSGLFSFWDPYNVNVSVFNVAPEISWLSFFFFSSFFLYSVLWQWFPPFCPPDHLSIPLPQLFCYWFLLVYYLSLFVCFFFISCRSLVNISCLFSIFASILFPRSWIIFTIIILNSFSGRLPVSISFSCFSGILSYPFIFDKTFCFVIVINFLWYGFCFSYCETMLLLLLLSAL